MKQEYATVPEQQVKENHWTFTRTSIILKFDSFGTDNSVRVVRTLADLQLALTQKNIGPAKVVQTTRFTSVYRNETELES